MHRDDTLPQRQSALLWVLLACLMPLAGCSGAQSTLAPAGQAAERIAALFWWMAGGSAVIWLGVLALAVYAARSRGGTDRRPQAKRLILVGAVLPAVVLGGLLFYGLALLPPLIAPAPEGSLRISVQGEQWWWRVRYEPPGGEAFEVANEVWLPVGEAVEFHLRSHDVIHSFWIPSLGGKMDLIPGRVNRLTLHPTRTGVYRGVCAEYCGTAHAKMGFDAVVVPREQFNRWMARQAEPAAEVAPLTAVPAPVAGPEATARVEDLP